MFNKAANPTHEDPETGKRPCLKDRGATAIEYGIIVALIAAVCIGIITQVGGGVSNAVASAEIPEETTPTPTPTPEPTWTTCASENGTCNLTGSNVVRYGAGAPHDVWTTRTLTGNVSCSNATFGDPLGGVVKQCQVSS